MKKGAILIALLLLSFSITQTFAQFRCGISNREVTGQLIEPEIYDYSPPENVKQLIITESKGKKKAIVHLNSFNEEGLMTGYQKNDNFRISYSYDNEGRITSIDLYQKDKLKSERTWTRNDMGYITDVRSVNTKGMVLNGNSWTYNESGDMLTSQRIGRNGKTTSHWEYEYYSPGERSVSRFYGRNGKLKREWVYDCKEEGEQKLPGEGQVRYCEWTEETDEFVSEIEESTNSNGRIVRRITKYTKKEHLLAEYSEKNANDDIITRMIYRPEINKLILSEYYRNGEQYMANVLTYEGEKLLAWKKMKKGKLKEEFQYQYKNGDLELINTVNGRNKVIKTTRIECVFY